MRITLVSHHNPEPEGTASGRAFWALGEGLVADGHAVTGWSWAEESPAADLPVWCAWRALPRASALAVRARALLRPRSDVRRISLPIPDDGVAVADDPESFAAVDGHTRSVATVHYLTRLDAAVRRLSPRDLQDVRAERHAYRAAGVVCAYSERVARGLGSRARVATIACPIPHETIPVVEEPVAGLLADWTWPPNRYVFDTLRRAWPEVRAQVPGARLLLAGRGLEREPASADGVEVLGSVARAADVLSRIAVLAFPCPDSSGPKMKVLEALAYGVPVVTTPPGMEGIVDPDGAGAVVEAENRFTEGLVRALADPELRAQLAGRGRASVAEAHGPVPAARARVAAIRDAFPDLTETG